MSATYVSPTETLWLKSPGDDTPARVLAWAFHEEVVEGTFGDTVHTVTAAVTIDGMVELTSEHAILTTEQKRGAHNFRPLS